jgi:hypothetical protein
VFNWKVRLLWPDSQKRVSGKPGALQTVSRYSKKPNAVLGKYIGNVISLAQAVLCCYFNKTLLEIKKSSQLQAARSTCLVELIAAGKRDILYNQGKFAKTCSSQVYENLGRGK